MYKIVIFRNCFGENAVSGGDKHIEGIVKWARNELSDVEFSIVHREIDGQEKYYEDIKLCEELTYKNRIIPKNTAIDFLIRAFSATFFIKMPTLYPGQSGVLVAGSHFIPDVIPIALNRSKSYSRAVYIHHIIQEMHRPKNLNNLLATIQEKITLFIIKRRFDKILIVNSDVKNYLKKRGFNEKKMFMTSNFVDIESHGKSYKQREISACYCGRFTKQKGVYDFVEICEALQKQVRGFRAVMLGDGPEREKIAKIIAGKSLDIQLYGYADEKTKSKVLNSSKLFLFPSTEEGWGIAPAEALAAGTPVLVYDLVVYDEVFGQEMIMHSPIGNKNKMSEKAIDYLKEYEDRPAQFSKLSNKLNEFSKIYNIDTVARKELDFLLDHRKVEAK